MSNDQAFSPSAAAGELRQETYTCICCPLGCQLDVTLARGEGAAQVQEVSGYTCKRGKDYAVQEATCPVRMVTVAVSVQGRLLPVSAKTAQPVPKASMPAVVAAAQGLRVVPPVRVGDVLLGDASGTGVALVATKDVE